MERKASIEKRLFEKHSIASQMRELKSEVIEHRKKEYQAKREKQQLSVQQQQERFTK